MKRIVRTSGEINENFLTVLIVEDNSSIRDTLHNGIKRYSYNVLSARNGGEAKIKLASERVHAVILDLILPQMSGLEVLKHIQEIRKQSGGFPFVIVITGVDTPENESLADQLGADEFIPKPVTIEEIAERLDMFQKRLVFTDSGYQFR